uniref:DNA-sulfur modification-associated protein n=1 Tax=Pithovirus LCPAC304 TaxID=2506594 RepID=A0A481Z845_9VIRU|nr:MAG: DNA-sulfur modification-associated protein [Pithovirus LCPAC304]
MFPFKHLSEHGRIRYVETNLEELQEYGKIYKGQRHVNPSRVREFLRVQRRYIAKEGFVHFPGVLTACQQIGEPKVILIDGQHRFSTMVKLSKSREYGDFPIILQIIRVDNEEELHQEFVNINKSVPVPGNILHPDQIVCSAISRLTSIYKKGFSDRVKMTRPRVPIDMLKDYLIERGVVEEKGIMSGAELVEYIVRTNEILRDRGVARLQKSIGRRDKVERARISKWYKEFEKGDCMHIGMYRPDQWGNWLRILMSIKQKTIKGKELESKTFLEGDEEEGTSGC